MSPQERQRIRHEADLIGRVAEYYRARFGRLIDRMNHPPVPSDPRPVTGSASDLACLRLCVEAVDMMLASQDQLARAVRELTAERDVPHRPLRPAA
jgi:hypothetical protein